MEDIVDVEVKKLEMEKATEGMQDLVTSFAKSPCSEEGRKGRGQSEICRGRRWREYEGIEGQKTTTPSKFVDKNPQPCISLSKLVPLPLTTCEPLRFCQKQSGRKLRWGEGGS